MGTTRAALRPASALVTGAGVRLGQAIALELAKRGFTIAVHYNSSAEGALETVRLIEAAGGKAAAVQADLANRDDAAGLVAKAAKAVGPLGVLINNASVFEQDEIKSLTADSWRMHMSVNLEAPVVLAQAFAAALPEDACGDVVNIIDQRVLKLNPRFFSYTLSKTALFSATQTLAQALAPRIRVNAVGPGPTLRNARQSEADFAKQAGATVLGHGASPQDVTRTVAYLLEAEAVTGQMIAVDGGQHLVWRTADVEGIPE
jgi:NAD(P)-dependent dehydrogenase (short-subunit alcohol dehydrogenase family)